MPYAAELDRLLERDEAAGHDLVYGELPIGDSGGRTRLLNSYPLIHFRVGDDPLGIQPDPRMALSGQVTWNAD